MTKTIQPSGARLGARIDSLIAGSLGTALLITAFALIVWWGWLVVAQCLYWLKAGDWHDLPLLVLFVEHPPTPKGSVPVLKYVPSFSATGLEAFLEKTQFQGVVKIILWCLQQPLGVFQWLLAVLAGWGAAMCLDDAQRGQGVHKSPSL